MNLFDQGTALEHVYSLEKCLSVTLTKTPLFHVFDEC